MRRALAAAALLLAPAACGSGEGAKAPDRAASAAGNASAAIVAPVVTPPALVAASAVTARRCGWLHNPTPGNWWLVDRQGEWTLAEQGGHQAEGMDDIPDMEPYDWQERNGHYGYGCACIDVTAKPDRTVTRIARVQPKPLKQCRADKALPRP